MTDASKFIQISTLGKEYLGTGYDLTGKYADAESVKRRIFDLSKVPDRFLRVISSLSSDYNSITGSTVEEYQKKLSIKAGVDVSYGAFSASVESSFTSTELSIEESAFVSLNFYKRYMTLKLQTTSPQYIHPDALQDFRTKDGLWLIENYGSGVVTGLDLGGRWSDNVTVSKLYKNSTQDIKVAMEAAYGAVSVNTSVEVSTSITSKKSFQSRNVTTVGGDPAFAPSNIIEWQKSVEGKAAFMDFLDDGLVLIWDVFPEQEEKLKAGFDEYRKQKRLQLGNVNIIEASFIDGYYCSSSRGLEVFTDERLDLYKPAVKGSTYKYVGMNGNDKKCLVIKELYSKYGALYEPVEWLMIWNDQGSGASLEYSVWLPIGPPGYVALGLFFRFRVDGYASPTADETEGFVMVHESLCQKTASLHSFLDEPEKFFAAQFTPVWHVNNYLFIDHSLILFKREGTVWASSDRPSASRLPTSYTLGSKYFTTD